MPKAPALALAKALEYQAAKEPHRLHREKKLEAAKILRQRASQMLTPSEQESLRQDRKEASALARKAFAKSK